jgi:hypothetical protein
MAVSPLPPLSPTPPAVRGAGFIPAFVPPTVPASPEVNFTRLVESARATGAPLPARGLEGAVPQPDGLSLLDRALVRDLVAGFERVSGALGAMGASPAFLGNLGAEGTLGRAGLPDALRNLGTREAVALYASLSSLGSALQAMASDGGPSMGSLLDVSV